MLWLGVAYLGALVALLRHGVLETGHFTSEIVQRLDARQLPHPLDIPVYRTVTFRTVGVRSR